MGGGRGESEGVCMHMCCSLSGLGCQLPLLLAPRAEDFVLKCLRYRLGCSVFHLGRDGSPAGIN